MVPEDDLDRRAWMREQPSYGPAWAAAIEYGIDVTLLEDALTKTMAQRFEESVRMTRFACEVEEARERLPGRRG